MEMLETFELWVRSSLTQSLLLSPLMGLVFGTAFSGLTGGEREKGTVSVKETVVIIKERIIVRERSVAGGAHSSDDPMGLVFLLAAAVVFSIYMYAIHAESLIYYFSIIIFNVASFGFAALFVSALKGRLSQRDWLVYTIVPIGILLFGLVLLYNAKLGMLSGAKEAAESVGAFKFYFNVLDERQKYWIVLQLTGMIVAVVFLFFSMVLVVHNISALQVVYDGMMRSFWRLVYSRTNAFSGKGTWIMLAILGAVSYFLLDGTAYLYLYSR